jgi:hypothetical protein
MHIDEWGKNIAHLVQGFGGQRAHTIKTEDAKGGKERDNELATNGKNRGGIQLTY